MHRRTFLTTLGAVAVAPVLAADAVRTGHLPVRTGHVACEPPPPAVATTGYYVSPDGDDGNTGRDPANPWKTISQVNARLAAGAVLPGDSVLFRKGQTFYGKIRPATGADGFVTFGGYTDSPADTARRPVISSYKILNTASGWNRRNRRTWVVDLSEGAFGTTHTGYDGAEGGADNIGFLRVDGVVHGRRVFGVDQLEQQWDFYCADGLLQVCSNSNPSELAADIRAACDSPCLELRDYVAIDGLRFEGSGGHGVQGSASHVRVRNSEFAELGGSLLYERTRYGNGVEVWIGSSDVVVENNIIHDVYDAALTMQGSANSDGDGWRDVTFRNNTIYRCNQSVEFWSEAQGYSAPGFVDCVVERNTCLFAGRGWSSAVRPDLDTGVHLLTYGWELPADIQVRHNVFYDGRSAYRYTATTAPGLMCSDNAVLQRAGARLQWDDPLVVERSSEWVAAQGNERGSVFVTLAADASFDPGATIRSLRDLLPDRSGAGAAAGSFDPVRYVCP